MPERRYLIHGRVQGVGFRWWTRSHASRLGLTGTVRNCLDGTVELHASGSDDALAELRALLQDGPSGARVEKIDEEPVSGVPSDDFEIIH